MTSVHRHWAAGLAAAASLYTAWRITAPVDAGASAGRLNLWLLCAFVLVAVVLLSRRARRTVDARARRAWWLITAGQASLLASLASLLVDMLANRTAPTPGPSDAFGALFYILLIAGLLRLSPRSATPGVRLRLAVDATITAACSGMVAWFAVLGPTLATQGLGSGTRAVATGYVAADLLGVLAVAYALRRAGGAATVRALALIGGGIAVTIVADLSRGWAIVNGKAGLTLALIDATYVVSLALFAFAAVAGNRRPEAGDEDASATAGSRVRRGRPMGATVEWLTAWLPPAVVLALLIGGQDGAEGDRMFLAIGVAVVTALVILRQVLTRHDLLDAQDELSHRALHDALTGLPNRVLLLDRASQLLARAEREQRPIAALFVDVDGFKRVNDTLGHAAGDQLLRVVAQRFAATVRGGDTVARMGGDEFVVLIDSLTLDVSPELVAERIVDVLRQPIELDAVDEAVRITVSVGVASARGGSADELLRDADTALYEAKAAGKNRVVVFEQDMQTTIADRMQLEHDLRDAVDGEQLKLLYQPTVDLDSEQVSGVEALLRWHHPHRGVIAPDVFIPLAESSGAIVPIGRWVLREACRQAAEWAEQGERLRVWINVSGRQLDDPAFVDDVRAALADAGLADPSLLTLEITETALMRDADESAKRLLALKELGVRLAIDDFGTGYSSLAYLRQFPVDALKIDRSFVAALASGPEAEALLRTLVELGKVLGLETIGEGIEDEHQLRRLQAENCDGGQGYLFAQPVDPQEIRGTLARIAAVATPTPIG